jgi:uncharacterized membrane protein YfcA
MYFPVAGIELNPLLPVAAAFAVSTFTSLGGVSGAFLLLPFQLSVLGFHSPAVSATNHVFNIVATPGSVWRYAYEGRIVWPLALVVALGAIPGVLIGALVRVHYLHDPPSFKVFIGLVLLYLGVRLVRDGLRRRAGRESDDAEIRFTRAARRGAVEVRTMSLSRLVYAFAGRRFEASTPALAALSVAVGMVGGIYGIGG